MNYSEVDIRKKCVPINEAIVKYPLLKKYLKNNGKLDLGDPIALRVYNQAIAKIHLNLDIFVPDHLLIPTICLRYYYIKILFEKFSLNSFIEIGTGATAILAMIGAKKYNISVTATEIDQNSFDAAKLNINNNFLENKINLIKSNGEILNGIIPDEKFDAILCYPPMYPENTKLSDNTRGFQGSTSEMIGGGDDGYLFIEQLITESISRREQIKILTVLNIKKDHADRSISQFEEHGLKNEMIIIKAGNRLRYLNIAYLIKKD